MRIIQRLTSGGMLLLFALVAGAATTVGTVSWLRAQADGTSETTTVAAAPTDAIEIVVTRESLPSGTRLAAPMLRLVTVSRSAVPEQVLTSVDAAAGLLTRYPLEANEPVLASRLVSEAANATGLAYAVPDGMRAVSVPFSEVMGAGGLMVPGDRVDVLVHTQYGRLFAPGQSSPVTAGEHAPVVITALQDVLVLAVGQEYAQSLGLSDARSARSDDVDAQPSARSVTLAVTPEQAQRLFLAAQEGTLGLALRGFGDESANTLTPLLRFETSSSAAGGLAAVRAGGS